MRMGEHFLEAGFDVNADGPATILGRTPLGRLLYLAPSSLPSYDMALLAPFLGDTMKRVNEESALDERVGVWVRILFLFIKFGADLQVQLESMWVTKRGAPKDDVVAYTRKLLKEVLTKNSRADPAVSNRACISSGVSTIGPSSSLRTDMHALSDSFQDHRTEILGNSKHKNLTKSCPYGPASASKTDECSRCKAVTSLWRLALRPTRYPVL